MPGCSRFIPVTPGQGQGRYLTVSQFLQKQKSKSFSENQFSTPGGPKRTSTTREQIVDVFAGEVQEKYENKNLDGDEAFLIGLSTLFEQPPSVA